MLIIITTGKTLLIIITRMLSITITPGKALLANADALCAAATPLLDLDPHQSLEGFTERAVMNNYFGIGGCCLPEPGGIH